MSPALIPLLLFSALAAFPAALPPPRPAPSGIAGAGMPGPIDTLGGIRFEYADRGPGTDLVLMAPGYTQHNRSLEYVLLRDHFLERGMSVLILVPAQHGEEYRYSGPLYGWGEREDGDLASLVGSLKLRETHPRIHALGFSMGAKTILRFAARPGIRGTLASVAAVAPPYRISDIDARLSGDIRKPWEAALSSAHALDLTDPLRVLYMDVVGLTRVLAVNRPTPADAVPAVEDPLLLVHGAGDWLIKSNHSVRLYGLTRPGQHAALVLLDTRTHAEDMLGRDRSHVRAGLLSLLDRWMGFAAGPGGRLPRDSLQAAFGKALDSVPWIADHRVPPQRVSRRDRPVLFYPLGGHWLAEPSEPIARAGAHYAHRPDGRGSDHLLLEAAPWRGNGGALGRLSASLALSDTAGSGDPEAEAGLSVACCGTGSVLLLRKAGFQAGFGRQGRRLLTADFTLYLLNFRLDFGRFFPGREGDLALALGFPLIGNASASYFLGAGYEAFLTDPGGVSDRDAFLAFAALGPSRDILSLRPRLILQYRQEGPFARGWHPRLSAGLSLAWAEL